MVKALPVEADREANLGILERLARPLIGKNLDILVTPECFLDGYMVKTKKWSRDDLKANAEPGEKGKYVQALARLASHLQSYLAAGFSECLDGQNLRNAVYLFDRRGEVRGKYYKIHVNRFYSRGSNLPVFDCDFGCVGIVICADRRWPENVRVLRLKGAELVLVPSYGMHHEHNRIWMQTRAYENGLFLCFTHPLQSLITGPSGRVEAILESNVEDVLLHDIDLSQIVPRKTRKKNISDSHPIQNRYPELYGELVKPWSRIGASGKDRDDGNGCRRP